MDYPTKPPASSGERFARVAVIAFLGLSTLTLAFALGFGLREFTDDDSPATGQPAASNGDSGSNGDSLSVGAAVIDEIVNILETQYVDRNELVTSDLTDAAIQGMIESLNDRETSYIPPADLAAGALQLNATYQGIGATVSDRSGEIRIVAPFRDSPAERAGLQAGDTILAVDGEPTDGWTDDMAVEKIRGTAGTTVSLEVRHINGEIETLEIVRGEIDIESVFRIPNLEVIPGESGEELVDRTGAPADDICYLAISQFHEKTHGELEAKAADIEDSGCVGLILDLRGNPGGGLQATIDVTDEFLDEGTIIIEQDFNGNQQVTSANPGGLLTEIPIIILQDAGSASGSEVLAAALRDNGRATILGTRSFGKGTVNRLVPLESCGEANCGAVYLSIGRWLTPNEELIEGLGIDPDVELEMTSEEYIDNGDLQIFEAIDLLRK
jgi:carboxyl-terminal processing protease